MNIDNLDFTAQFLCLSAHFEIKDGEVTKLKQEMVINFDMATV